MLAAALVLASVPVLAENTKHERVYIVAGPDGTVRTLTDNIRLENADELDEMIDCSRLTAIENVGGKETFAQDGEKLIWQAQGKDITYQGTSDRLPAVQPVARVTVDGKKISFDELQNAVGDAVVEVTYRTNTDLPVLALSVLPLPSQGISELTMENAAVFSEAGIQAVVGIAMPGVDPDLGLPVSFWLSFRADHADLSWMMTVATSDPLVKAAEALKDRTAGMDASMITQQLISVLTALRDGTEMPESTGLMGQLTGKISQLNHGLQQLNDGADALKAGIEQVMGGVGSTSDRIAEAVRDAAEVNSSLAQLKNSSDSINAGADALVEAMFKAAQEQIAAAGQSATELTRDNYVQVLEELMETTPSDAWPVLQEHLDQTVAFADALRQYTDQVSGTADGSAALSSGLIQLNIGTAVLLGGGGALTDGAAQLKDGTQQLMDAILNGEKMAASLALPMLNGGLSQALTAYQGVLEHRDQAGYDLRPADMDALTVYIIRTDLRDEP